MPAARSRGERAALALGSDVELARAVLARLRDGAPPLVHADGRFLRYAAGDGIWATVPRHDLERGVHALDGATIGDRQLRITQGRVRGALDCAAAQATVPGFLDGAPAGLCFRNGFLALDGGLRLAPHDPAHRATCALPFEYDPEADAPRWRRALAEIFALDDDRAEKEALLQEFTGASLLGLAPRYKAALVPIGQGDNGKSMVIDVLSALFPESARASIPPHQLEHEYYRAMLRGVRWNAVSEIPESDLLSSEAFKAVISGDAIVAREPRERAFTFRPLAGHVFAGNSLPATRDQSAGFWGRLLPLPFTRSFSRHEREIGLAGRILATELPGVARWALDGAARLLRTGGYTLPASVAIARDRWQRNTDQVRLFVDERVRPLAADGTAGSLVYRAYADWAVSNGHRPLASNRFAERLEGLGFKKFRRSDGNYYPCELTHITHQGGRP